MTDKPTLYGIWLSGPAYKVALALSFLGIDYSYVHVNLREGEQKAPDFIALNRYGQVPVLKIDGLVLCQSSAIIEYLAARSGQLGGADAAQTARVREWQYWSADKLNGNLFGLRRHKRGFRSYEPAILRLFADEAAAALGTLEAHLSAHDWLAGGQVTLADIDVFSAVWAAADAEVDLAAYPAVVAWQKRFSALPGYGDLETLLPKESRS